MELTKNKPKISAVIIAKNEEENLIDCLNSLDWVDEIVVVDNQSTDKTSDVAKKFGAIVYDFPKGDFSTRKNFAYSKITHDWFLSVDADERVTPELKKEIVNMLSKKSEKDIGAYALPRRNFILGKELKRGWWPDYVIRLFNKTAFKEMENVLHEQPKFEGELKYLMHPLIHIKHNNLEEMVDKTNEWSNVEAGLMFEHPPMNIIRFGTAVFRELWQRFIKDKAFLDGSVGVLYGLYQVYSRLISYVKLWEMQQKQIIKH